MEINWFNISAGLEPSPNKPHTSHPIVIEPLAKLISNDEQHTFREFRGLENNDKIN